MDRRDVLFDRIADVIECERRHALTDYAFTEWLWHRHSVAVMELTGPPNVGRSQYAA